MAAYFQLYPIGSDVPAKFADIDDAMCADFGAEPTDRYYCEWFDCVGFALALGNTWERTRELFPRHHDICDWLEARYTVDAWSGR